MSKSFPSSNNRRWRLATLFFTAIPTFFILAAAGSNAAEKMNPNNDFIKTYYDSAVATDFNESCYFSAMSEYECSVELQNSLDAKMAKKITSIKKHINNEYGTEADAEIKARLDLTQESWKKYRFNHCTANYYTKAGSHPPSESLHGTMCIIKMTLLRLHELHELNETFNNPHAYSVQSK